ncbi:MAG TPA: hypothetical protein VIU82_25040 [Bosea sp. (in: a-proteobacteria)]
MAGDYSSDPSSSASARLYRAFMVASSELKGATGEVDAKVTNIILGRQNIIGYTISGTVRQAAERSVIVGDSASLSDAITRLGVP